MLRSTYQEPPSAKPASGIRLSRDRVITGWAARAKCAENVFVQRFRSLFSPNRVSKGANMRRIRRAKAI